MHQHASAPVRAQRPQCGPVATRVPHIQHSTSALPASLHQLASSSQPNDIPRQQKRGSRRCHGRRLSIQTRAASTSAPTSSVDELDPTGQAPVQHSSDRSHTTDYVVIGSGIGGLCCAALLARYGYRVTVCESHYLAGGAAHSFKVKGYTFDADGYVYVQPGHQPAASKLQTNVETKRMRRSKWIVYNEQGVFPCVANRDAYLANIRTQGGQEALEQWLKLEQLLKPLQAGAALFPAAAIRTDPGVLFTSLRFLGPELLTSGLVAGQLTGPFSAVVDRVVTNKWLRAFLDLECFVLSGMGAKDTLCAEMAFMFLERNSGRSAIDYPMGGSGAIIDALVRGITKYGGRVLLSSHVEEVVVEGGRAVGVKLRPQPGKNKASKPEIIRARLGVVSNASGWDTQRLLPAGVAPPQWRSDALSTPPLDSMVHLHLGIDATGLPSDLECHHLFVKDWYRTDAENNVMIASIPTVFDPSMAPPGKATVHAYFAGNEPYGVWEGMDRRSQEYKQLKQQRAEPLWQALERVIPDIRQRAELTLIGTPLTHERFLRRHRGTYGAGISASTGKGWPGPKTPTPGLYVCGDSTMPGIGVPAAAASGMMCANTLAPVWAHLAMMDRLVPASK